MFKSCGWVRRIDDHSAEYRITDDDFVAHSIGSYGGFSPATGYHPLDTPVRVCDAVIREYSKRGLNVAPNLARACMFLKRWHYDMREFLVPIRNNPKYERYVEDIDKWLLLL